MQQSGLIFRSIPDSGTCGIQLTASGVPELIMPNCLVFAPGIDAALKRMAREYWFPQPEVPLPRHPPWILNTCADTNTYAMALEALDDAYGTTTPVFNHPRAVMAARRDIAGTVLKGVPGLEFPKCRRFRAAAPQSFEESFSDGGFHYPVTVQPAAARNGIGRQWIASPDDWCVLFNQAGGGQRYMMVQADPEEKAAAGWLIRMVFIGRGGTVRTMREPSATTAGPASPASRTFVETVFRAANRLMPLDFWTMDMRVMTPDKLRLVDIGAGLHVPSETDQQPAIRAQAIDTMAEQAQRLKALLADPSQWRDDARHLQSVAMLGAGDST